MSVIPPADRFRVGEVWQSPRMKTWRVEKIHHTKGAFLRATYNRFTTQWRNELATGDNMNNAWIRISTPQGENQQ